MELKSSNPINEKYHEIILGLRDGIIQAAVQNIKLLSFLEMAQFLNSGHKQDEMMRTLFLQMKLVTQAQKVYFFIKNGEKQNYYCIYNLNHEVKLLRKSVHPQRMNILYRLFQVSRGQIENLTVIYDRYEKLKNLTNRKNQNSVGVMPELYKMALIRQIFAQNNDLGFFVAIVGDQLSLFDSRDKYILEAFTEKISMAILKSQLHSLSVKDSLTKLYLRRYFEEKVATEIYIQERTKRPFSLILLDLDDFKDINDQHMNPAGDIILKEVSDLIVRTLRDIDVTARMGGDEIAILTTETDSGAVYFAAERIRKLVEIKNKNTDFKVTCSFGVCESRNGMNFPELYKQSDMALYQAKRNGRNRVEHVAE